MTYVIIIYFSLTKNDLCVVIIIIRILFLQLISIFRTATHNLHRSTMDTGNCICITWGHRKLIGGGYFIGYSLLCKMWKRLFQIMMGAVIQHS